MTQLDDFDQKILAALQRNGRLTNLELAQAIGLSPSQCSRRRARLESERIIRGYRTDIDTDALGLKVRLFIRVKLATHSPNNAKRFAEFVAKTEEILEAFSLTGDTDYLLHVLVQDLNVLATFINDVLLQHPSVAQVNSSIVLKSLI